MKKIKPIIIWVIIFIVGFSFGASGKTRIVTKEVPVVKETVKEVEVCKNEELWRRLKEIDDKGFSIAANGFYTVSDIFEAQSQLDFVKAKSYISKLEEGAKEMDKIARERQEILGKLGY